MSVILTVIMSAAVACSSLQQLGLKSAQPTVVLAPSGGDDTAAIQEAVDGLGSAGGTIRFVPGTYRVGSPIELPAANTGTTVLSGYGATIQLTNTTARFLVWRRTALHEVFRKFSIEGFTVDAQNGRPAKGSFSVLGFDMAADGVWDAAYLSIEEITVKRCRVVNVATSPTGEWNACGINIYTSQRKSREAAWDHVDDVVVSHCRIEGGARGVNIWGGGPEHLSVSLDRISIRDCWHDTFARFAAGSSSSNYHIGQTAKVGRAEVTGCYGNRSGDVGVEMDNCSQGLVADCTIENPYWTCYYYTNYNEPLRRHNSVVYRHDAGIVAVASVGAGSQNGFQVSSPSPYPIGTITIMDCTYEVTAPVTTPRAAVLVDDSVVLRLIRIRDLATVCTTQIPAVEFLDIRPASGRVVLDNVTVNGSVVDH